MSEVFLGHIFRYLDTVGDGTGTKNAIGNHASAAEEYKIVPPSDETYILERVLISIRDTGTFDAENYGNGVGLTNGIIVEKRNGSGQLLDLTDGLPIMHNAGWGAQCFDISHLAMGTGDEIMNIRWTFSRSGQPIRLDGVNGEYLSFTLNDDFSGLVQHYFQVQGWITHGATNRVDAL